MNWTPVKLAKKSLALIFSLCFSLSTLSIVAFANDNDVTSNNYMIAQVSVITNGESIPLGDMTLEPNNVFTPYSFSNEQVKSETYSAIIEIDKSGAAKLVDSMPALSRNSSDSHSEENVYWKASVTVTYSVDSSLFGKLIYVSGYWSQLRSDSELANRHVYYGQGGSPDSSFVDKYPTSNNFSYTTGFNTIKIATIGCSSDVDIINIHGGSASATLRTNVYLNSSDF